MNKSVYFLLIGMSISIFMTANAIILNTYVWNECYNYIYCCTSYMFLGAAIGIFTIVWAYLEPTIKKELKKIREKTQQKRKMKR